MLSQHGRPRARRIKKMNAALGVFLAALAVGSGPSPVLEPTPPPPVLAVADVVGAWSGTLTHDGETAPLFLELEAADEGKVRVKATVPAIHLAHVPIALAVPQTQGNELRIGPFSFTYDPGARTLSGTMPEALVPVYRIPLILRRTDHVDVEARPEPAAPLVEPTWTFDAGSPLWAGATFAEGRVYTGGQDGALHALDAQTGKESWSFRAGGAIRTRATVAEGELYFQADDGFLYKLSAATGTERWRVRVVEKPIVRLPFDDPKSRFDRFGSDVTTSGGRLFLGTHDGHVLAVDPVRGSRIWEFAAGDSVLAAPAVDSGRLYFGSYDRHVYALDAATGKLLWKRDTNGAVVSTPAVDGDRLVVGNRCYDLLTLATKTGDVVWKRYIWFSWIESSALVRDGVAYVGSSDAAAAYAFDVGTGRPLWAADVYGWAWGQPAVTDQRVYVGTASQQGYLAGHRGGLMALDRRTGRPVWRYAAASAASGSYGFPGSPAIGSGLLFVTGLDGRVYAFAL
jgi:outer membrane protein assembly factor BamB